MTNYQSINDIDSVLESENLQKFVKLLVNEQLNKRDKVVNPLQKLSDILSNDVNGYKDINDTANKNNAPVIPINDLNCDGDCGYGQEEIQMRCQLASLYRLMDLHGWTLLIYNHITLRNKGDSKEFFINPLGLLYREVTASSLVKINLEGETLDPGSTVFGINKAGWSLHAAVHDIREDVRCIIHTHVPDVIAVSCLKYGLLPLSQEAVDLLDESPESLSRGVRYHNYWGIAVTQEEWPSLKEDIGLHSKVLILRNHGVLVCGDNCAEAWILMKRVVNACENQIRLLQSKGEQGLLSMEFKPLQNVEMNDKCLLAQRIDSAELEFEAMMLMLDNCGHRTGHTYCYSDVRKKGCGLNYRNEEPPVDSTMANLTDLSIDTPI